MRDLPALLRSLRVLCIVCTVAVVVGAPGAVAAAPCPNADDDDWGVAVPGCDASGLDGVGDCDDSNAAVNPAATEVCGDDLDNDCNGSVDFGLYVNDFGDPPVPGIETGTCFLADPSGCEVDVDFGDPPSLPATGCCLTAGHKVCKPDNTGVVCESNSPGFIRTRGVEGPPGDDSCFSGGDDDCDGFEDHEDTDCQTAEVCNGFDDDGDGTVDEDFTLGEECTVGVGACERTGVLICDGLGGTTCNRLPGSPTTENTPGKGRCTDGIDNDCDGTVDLADDSCQATERCDGTDNDGNGAVDETFADLGTSCSVGVGTCAGQGMKICTVDGSATVCDATLNLANASTEGPSGPTCSDGVDNDCDGITDGADPGCGSSAIRATCSLEPLQKTANGASCEGWYRLHFATTGAAANAKVTAELVGIDTAGNQVGLLNVRDLEVAHLNSRLDSASWKFTSKPNKNNGALKGPGNWHEVFAPVPLLRVQVKDALSEAVAYCAPIPWLDVVRPDGAVVSATNAAGTLDVLAALPLVNPDSLSVLVNGVDVLDALGIDPVTAFPGTHPGGDVTIDGKTVTISDIVVDIASSISALSANTLRMKITGLDCGGSDVVVDGDGTFPPGTVLDVTKNCDVDDIHDCGSAAVFQLRIDSPTEGEITSEVPTPVTGEVCHGLEIVQASINGKELDVEGQDSTPGNGECAGGTFRLPIATALNRTNDVAEALGVNAEVGTFDAGSNRLIATATDVEANRDFKTFIFGVGEPSEIISSVASAQFASSRALQWQFDMPPVAEVANTVVTGTAIVDSFVLGLEPAALGEFFAAACADASEEVKTRITTSLCAIDTTKEVDSPCCDPDVRTRAIGCNPGDPYGAPSLLGDFQCTVQAFDGPGPDGTGGTLVVAIGIPRIEFFVRSRGDCCGGFLWGCNTDVDMDLKVTFPHPGEADCPAGGANVCPGCNPGDPPDGCEIEEDCCVPTQPLNRIDLTIDETDFEAGSTTSCACDPGDTECLEKECCDPATPGCISGSLVKSGIMRLEKVGGSGFEAGGWNVVLLGFVIFIAGALLGGPIGAILGGALALVIFATFSGNSLSGLDVAKDILKDVDVGQITIAVKEVTPKEPPYNDAALAIDTELADVKINANGVTAVSDIGITPTQPDPRVEESLGFLSTPASPPMPPTDDGNTFITVSDDLFNGIFAAAARQGQISSETCGGSLAAGKCCRPDDPGFQTVNDLFPADCTDPDFVNSGNPYTNAAITGICLGIHATVLAATPASALCESFSGLDNLATQIGQATCHGVRGATCSGIPANGLLERGICQKVPPWNVKASDPLLLCVLSGIEPRFFLSDTAGTPEVESRLHLNDLLVTVAVDRATNGYDGAELKTMATCLENATTADCRLLGVCLDLNFNAKLTLVEGAEGPEIKFDLGDPINQPRPAGEPCEGGVNLKYNYDDMTSEGAAESDPIQEDLTENAAGAVPVQAPQNISFGDLVQLDSPTLFAIKTSSSPGRCTNDVNQECTSDADCGAAQCFQFQDYLGLRGVMVQQANASMLAGRSATDASACSPQPLTACRQPASGQAARLALKSSVKQGRDRATWSWSGGKTDARAIGDPMTSETYAFCVYEGNPQTLLTGRTVRAGDKGWKAVASGGFAYQSGTDSIRLTPGKRGNGRTRVKSSLELPYPLDLELPLTVQLQATNGSCWEARYYAPTGRRTAGDFAAKVGFPRKR